MRHSKEKFAETLSCCKRKQGDVSITQATEMKSFISFPYLKTLVFVQSVI